MVETGEYNVLYTQNDINAQVMRLGAAINKYHKDAPLPSVWVCILNGGVRMFSDTTRFLAFDGTFDFCKVNSYEGTQKISAPRIQRFSGTDLNEIDLPKNARIYIFDDILDSGDTAKLVAEYYEANFSPAEMVLCTTAARESAPLDELKKHYSQIWSLFTIKDEWLVGYGMDNPSGFMRQLPNILKLKTK